MSLRISFDSVERVGITAAIALFLVLVMLTSIVPLHDTIATLEEKEERREQFGGGSIEEQCSSITFEDMFTYNQANFDIQIDEGWQTAQVTAQAWINWTLADDIREDLDAYLDGIVPSGGDSWLSTDEVGAVVLIAADCLQHSLTRIGIRDGAPHRGGDGVDWKNTTWRNDGMDIGEYNGVPPRHAEGRDCQGFNQGDCYEVPVIPAVERDCDMDVNETMGADECRVILWLNATLEIDGVTDPNDFTIAFNSSNMSNARLDFTFPHITDLRLDIWEECEGRFVGPDEDFPGGGSTPLRGSCIGDGSSSHELTTNDDGTLTYTLFPSLQRQSWPYGEDLYADFTTSPVPVDNPPTWTDLAPENGSWFPVAEQGQSKWVSWQELSSWFEDESGVSNLEIECMAGDTGEISQSIDRSLWVTVDGLVEISCHATDSSEQSSGNRTWNFGVPIAVSTYDLSLSDPHPIVIDPATGWPEITVEVGLVQEGEPRNVETIVISSLTEIGVTSADMLPGAVFVWVRAYHTEDRYMEHVYDFGITKVSSPPLLMVSSTDWDGSLWRISGQYSDPDGEAVTFLISLNGEEFGEVRVDGNAWESNWLDMGSVPSGTSNVDVTGCDQSNKCTTITQIVNNSHIFELSELEPEIASDADDESSLPAAGVPSMALSLVAALMYARRRE